MNLICKISLLWYCPKPICLDSCVYVWVSVCVCVHISKWVSMCVCMFVCMYTRACACACACMCVCVCPRTIWSIWDFKTIATCYTLIPKRKWQCLYVWISQISLLGSTFLLLIFCPPLNRKFIRLCKWVFWYFIETFKSLFFISGELCAHVFCFPKFHICVLT